MFDHNFWEWLLIGIEQILVYFLSLTPLHFYIGLAELAVVPVFYAAIIVLIVFGSFIHLQLGSTLLGLVFVMETARSVYAIWKWIKGIIL